MSTSCGNPATEQDALMTRRTKFDQTKTCVKCKGRTGNIVIRHAVYCKVCFFPLVSTRFRKVLGPTINAGGRTPKNANARGGRLRGLLKAPGSLVIGHSGGLGSTVLLDLVAKSYFYRSTTTAGDDSSALGTEHPRNKAKEDGGSADVWKGNPAVCYVEVASAIPGAKDRTEEVRAVIQAYSDPLTKFEIDFIPLRLEDVFDVAWWKSVALPMRHKDANATPLQSLHAYLSSLPTPTAVHSAISSLIRVLLLYTSASRNASHLLLGTSLTSLSMNTISGLAQGAGFALVSESIDEGWTPTHSQHINIVRPLRDVGIKESAFWAWWLKLPVAGRDRYPSTSSSIDALTYNFIMGLEKDYPSTVSTIARTIAKVTTKETGVEGGCILCQKPAQRNVQAWKASISIRSYHDESFVNAKHPLPPHYTAPPALEETTDAEPSFPTSVYLAPRLCYACHTTFTSRSSRGSSSANSIVIPLPVWVKANVTLLDPAGGSDSAILTNDMDRTQGDVAGEDAEVWKVKKLSPGHIKDKIGGFLLDDAE
ncbi:hypothetical protein FA13DRAFT_1625797 [Coprinellus micaceus]|uniref:Cytoplasmic tRNA 2-thiolation protein 2 n=1 Tax=Coprinellus micaceus TaxID=71717 RepID=A0A4Y7TLC8_COPMI|nr:hypothetical protein FA13DRAFT_1625797 [Coprinellus micaceus]